MPELVRLVAGYGLLEGARWYPEHGLLFSDMNSGGVHRLRTDGGAPEVVVPHRKAIGGLVAHADGGLVISGRNVSHKAADGTTTVLLDAAPDEQFFNDLTADRRGRVFAGSMPRRGPDGVAPGAGRLYQVELDGSARVLADDVLISNGISETVDGTGLLHVDSERRLVWRYTLSDGLADGREPFVDTSEYAGLPDGIAVAADGSVWVAIAGGGVVVAWDARGRRTAEVPVPAALVTSVCFGGHDLRTLYVLTGTDAEHPYEAGAMVLAGPAPVAGVPAPRARVRPA